jgi:hypothetical protein
MVEMTLLDLKADSIRLEYDLKLVTGRFAR